MYSPTQQELHTVAEGCVESLKNFVLGTYPESDQRATALSKMDEVKFWLQQASLKPSNDNAGVPFGSTIEKVEK